MQLYLSVEGQNCIEIGLSQILAETQSELSCISRHHNENESKYGSEFALISIIPTCVDEEMWKVLGWKERVLLKRKKREADVRLRINYEKFVASDKNEKKKLFIGIITDSIRIIQERSKGDFDGQTLIEDILELTK